MESSRRSRWPGSVGPDTQIRIVPPISTVEPRTYKINSQRASTDIAEQRLSCEARGQTYKHLKNSNNSEIYKEPEDPPITKLIHPSIPWIYLRYNSSIPNKSNHDSASIYTILIMQKQDLYFRYSEKSESLRSVNMPSEIAAGDEESVHTANLDAASSTTVRAQSATSTAPSAPESKIVYPSTFRVLLIVLSLSLSTLLVALDRTIVPTAM